MIPNMRMMETVYVTASPGWLEYFAAGVTLASAVVIAWQAYLTRQAVASAQAAVRESQIARLEAGVPRVLVQATPVMYGAKVSKEDGVFGWLDIETEEIFRLPRDSKMDIRVLYPISFTNDGPGSVQLKLTRGFLATGAAYSETALTLAAGTTTSGAIEIVASVATWVQVSQNIADKKEVSAMFYLEAKHEGPRDADVAEYFNVQFLGSVLTEDPDQTGDWTARWSATFAAEVLPATRKYWKSRSKREPFDF